MPETQRSIPLRKSKALAFGDALDDAARSRLHHVGIAFLIMPVRVKMRT